MALRSAFTSSSSAAAVSSATQANRTAMTVFDIQITSDIVCPWCYIGHTRLSKAIKAHQEKFPQDQFNLRYTPYYLNPPPPGKSSLEAPSFPVKSKPRMEVYAEKFGAERAQQILKTLSQIADSEGLHFKSGGKTGSSRNGHRLVRYAQSHGGEKAQNDTMLGLWKRYYEREVDITELDVLVEVGVEAGLGSQEEIRTYLTSGQDTEEVDSLAQEQRERGITGVPHYTLQNRWEISGGQEPSVFQSIFTRYKDMEAKSQAPSM